MNYVRRVSGGDDVDRPAIPEQTSALLNSRKAQKPYYRLYSRMRHGVGSAVLAIAVPNPSACPVACEIFRFAVYHRFSGVDHVLFMSPRAPPPTPTQLLPAIRLSRPYVHATDMLYLPPCQRPSQLSSSSWPLSIPLAPPPFHDTRPLQSITHLTRRS